MQLETATWCKLKHLAARCAATVSVIGPLSARLTVLSAGPWQPSCELQLAQVQLVGFELGCRLCCCAEKYLYVWMCFEMCLYVTLNSLLQLENTIWCNLKHIAATWNLTVCDLKHLTATWNYALMQLENNSLRLEIWLYATLKQIAATWKYDLMQLETTRCDLKYDFVRLETPHCNLKTANWCPRDDSLRLEVWVRVYLYAIVASVCMW